MGKRASSLDSAAVCLAVAAAAVAALASFVEGANRVELLPESLMDDPVFTTQYQEKIVGGEIVGHLPYQVSIQARKKRRHFCGGTVVSKNYVLTAAHCVAKKNLRSKIRIVAGERDMDEDSGHEQVRFASRILVHPKFDRKTLKGDIALVKLSRSLRLDDGKYVSSIPLASDRGEDYLGSTALVSGWGTLRSGDRILPNELRAVRVPVRSDYFCRRAYGNDEITDSMICAGKEGRDSCQGDSGGPLVCDGGELCGVVSWGKGCALRDFPGVYTEVSHYVDWVATHVKDLKRKE